MNSKITLALTMLCVAVFASVQANESEILQTKGKRVKKYDCLRVNNELRVCGDELIDGDLTVVGNGTFGSTTVIGNETVGGNLIVTGTVFVDGSEVIDGNLTVDGSVFVNSSESIGLNLYVLGDETVGGNVVFNNLILPLNVVGSAETADARMVWGGNSSATATAAPASGSSGIGTSITFNSTGSYSITWSTAFTTAPFVVASLANGTDVDYIINVITESTTGCTINIYNTTGTAENALFNIIAIGH